MHTTFLEFIVASSIVLISQLDIDDVIQGNKVDDLQSCIDVIE